jgi:hypothetical protein
VDVAAIVAQRVLKGHPDGGLPRQACREGHGEIRSCRAVRRPMLPRDSPLLSAAFLRLGCHPVHRVRSVSSRKRGAAQERVSTAPLKRSLHNLEFSGPEAAFGPTSSPGLALSLDISSAAVVCRGAQLRRQGKRSIRASRCRGLSSSTADAQKRTISTRLRARIRIRTSGVVPPAGFHTDHLRWGIGPY